MKLKRAVGPKERELSPSRKDAKKPGLPEPKVDLKKIRTVPKERGE